MMRGAGSSLLRHFSKTGAAIIELLTSFAGDHTVIITTHDKRIARVADRVVYLADGSVEKEVGAARAMRTAT